MRAGIFIGIMWIWILVQGWGNIIEGQDTLITEDQAEEYTLLQEHTQSVTSTTGGTDVISLDWLWNAGQTIWTVFSKVFLFDYTFFKDVENADPITGDVPANDFVILRYLLIAMGIYMWTEIILFLRQLWPS